MRKLLLLTVLAFSLLVSCKKSGSASSETYHFTASIDGQALTLLNPEAITWGIAYNVTQNTFQGFSETDKTNPTIRLTWTNTSAGTNLGLGTWSDTATNYTIVGSYLVTPYEGYSAGTDFATRASQGGVTITNHLKINITYMDSTNVKGTFSGGFYYLSEPTGAKKTITGEFYLPWK